MFQNHKESGEYQLVVCRFSFLGYNDEPTELVKAVNDYKKLVNLLVNEYGGHVVTGVTNSEGLPPPLGTGTTTEHALEELKSELLGPNGSISTYINSPYFEETFNPEKAMITVELRREKNNAKQGVIGIMVSILLPEHI